MEENNRDETLEQTRRRKISETKKRKFAENGSPLKGRAKSEEHRRAIGAANTGKRRTADDRAKIREARMAAEFSEDSRRAASERIKLNPPSLGVKRTPDQRKAQSEARTGTTPLLKKYGIEPSEYEIQIGLGNKWCSEGKHFSPAGSFQKRRTFCQQCKTAHHRHMLLRAKYGVTAEWYVGKLLSQGGGCAMCGTTKMSKGWNFLAIDHDHATGKTRGILCHQCNTGLGIIESPGFIQRAAAYLAQYGTILRVEEIPASALAVPETEQTMN